ncbi:M3 family oligoendopeptidase [Patescibacteria group bacterium]|nr:M3 family oligoendopeptidase [Patescibacteria group bacterium]
MQWDLTNLFPDDNSKEFDTSLRTLEDVYYSFINAWKDRKDYLVDPLILKVALDEYEALAAQYGGLGSMGYFFLLRKKQDQLDTNIIAKFNKINDVLIKLGNDLQFFTHSISHIPAELQPVFLEAPILTDYKHMLTMLFANAKYLLSEPEEKILNLKSVSSYSNWVSLTSKLLSKEDMLLLEEDGSKAKKPFSYALRLMDSQQPKVRSVAAKRLNTLLKKHVDVAEQELNSILYDKKTDDVLRHVERPDMIRHLADDIETSVVDSMRKAVKAKFGIAHDYYKLKSELLDLPKLKYYERNVRYGDVDMKITFNEAVDLLSKVFTDLDPEFYDIFKQYLDEKRIDVYPNKGKVSGAFSIDVAKKLPGYVLLNYTDTLQDVLTLAHEMGHAINAELIKKTQNGLNCETSLAVAEVASTFMEDFVLQEVLKDAGKEKQLAIRMMRLNDDISTIFRQVACYEFEMDLHLSFREKNFLSKQDIGKIFRKHMKAYMGPFVEQSAGSQNWWVYWSHIRRYFYVYSYASGLLISKSMQTAVSEDKAFIHKVKDFLSAGTAQSPKDLFINLGIDIASQGFWEKGLDQISLMLSETRALARELKKVR